MFDVKAAAKVRISEKKTKGKRKKTPHLFR